VGKMKLMRLSAG